MHLNPFLFPAPRTQRKPKFGVEELLWIPKYKKDGTSAATAPRRVHKVSQSMDCLDVIRKSQSNINGSIPIRVAHSKYKRNEAKNNVCSLGDLDMCFSVRTTVNPGMETQFEDASFGMLDSPVKIAPVFLEKKFRGNHFFGKLSKASTDVNDELDNIDFEPSVVNPIKKPASKGWDDCDLTIMEEDMNCDLDADHLEEHPINATGFMMPKTLTNYKLKANEQSHLFKTLTTEPCEDRVKIPPYESRIPKKKELIGHIPCLLIRSREPSNKLLIYFHGNGEDIFHASELLLHIRNSLNVNVMAMEYPGYSVYKGDPSEESILEDTETLYDYLTQELNFDPQNLILFGRSIGSGPATWLASRKEVGALSLMSAFTSIRGVVRDLAGKFLQYIIKERFNNLENIAKVQCPTFIVHGIKDTFISYKHSQELYRACQSRCELILPERMNHVEFDFDGDFTRPLSNFLRRRNIDLDSYDDESLHFPAELFRKPAAVVRS